MSALSETDLIRLREKCLVTALDRHDDDDEAFALAERLVRFMLEGPAVTASGADSQSVPKALVDGGKPPSKTESQKPRVGRRFTDVKPLNPQKVTGLPENHDAVTEGRTLFPSTVVDPTDSPALLVSGANNRKLGDRIVKGPWAGMAIYHLTLEERATCPRSCENWRTCYGNGMQMARRHRHGPELVERLDHELAVLSARHEDGFAVRLHTLGDFYDVGYVNAWLGWLEKYPRLHVFGYTAHPKDSEIGRLLAAISREAWNRFAMRFSGDTGAQGAKTIYYTPDGPTVEEGTVCPAQTGKTDCCGTCGLCWHPKMQGKAIAFVAHGQSFTENAGKKKEPKPVGETVAAKAERFVLDQIAAGNHAITNAEIAEGVGTTVNSASVYVSGLVADGRVVRSSGGKYSRRLHLPDAKAVVGNDVVPTRPASPVSLTKQQLAVWRASAELIVEENGLSPLMVTIAIRAGVGVTNVPNHIEFLERHGYLKRIGQRRAMQIHIVKWPEGMKPTKTVGRIDNYMPAVRLSDKDGDLATPKANVELIDRKCLNCRTDFKAEGPFIRLCMTCRHKGGGYDTPHQSAV